jgi:hypothetical protein
MEMENDKVSRDVLSSQPLTFRPYHPDKMFYEDRLTTFNSWSKQIVPNKYSLSKSGLFYSGQSDRCICAFCNLGLYDWSTPDVPLDEHYRHAPGCSFLKMIGHGDKKTEGKTGGVDIPPPDTIRQTTTQRF